MPIQKAYPIREVINELKKYKLNRQRRISFEYILFRGLNDTPAHVKELARLLNGLRCRINLIRFHSIPGVFLEKSD
jgi:23S rRNA (adenine2503-C2)-methyltransferase